MDHESNCLFETAGYAIGIRDNCDINEDSYSDLNGMKYELPPEVFLNKEDGSTYMAGAKNYQVKEIEVFQVNE